LEEALSAAPMMRLSGQDRGFARALVMAALRHLGPIDRALDLRFTREPPAPARQILRLGAAQLFFLDTPPHAAVDTSVSLAPKPLRGLVNAVLRALQRGGPPPEDPTQLAPDWLFARWRQAYGDAEARAIAASIAEEPAMDLTLKPAEHAGALAAALEGEVLPGGSVRTRRGGDITTWSGFDEGGWWIQDAAAAIPARLLATKAGETALDMCAAPGGKTFQMAAAGAEVTALDRSDARLKRVRESLTRLGLGAGTEAADAAAWGERRTFDAVLLDAPCSATGTFRRHPDVLWNAKPGDIARLAASQARLLDAAAEHTRPGGRMVYSVCSLEPEEGEAQIAPVLARNPDMRLSPIQPGEGGAPGRSLRADGTLRILPHHLAGGLDGFFIARFEKAAG
jgi:16S rRNA (cytosine967-C5)-methyltransferase